MSPQFIDTRISFLSLKLRFRTAERAAAFLVVETNKKLFRFSKSSTAHTLCGAFQSGGVAVYVHPACVFWTLISIRSNPLCTRVIMSLDPLSTSKRFDGKCLNRSGTSKTFSTHFSHTRVAPKSGATRGPE